MSIATRKEVAAQIGISVQTLRNWCRREQISLPSRRLLTAREVQHILQAFGRIS